MISVAIIGASGYTGAEMSALIQHHPELHLNGLYVSEQSLDRDKPLSQLYPALAGIVDLPLQPLGEAAMQSIAAENQAVVLATSHEVSHQLAAQFYAAGLAVFDLSGAYRFKDTHFYQQYYGFEHQHPEVLAKAVYGLAEWQGDKIADTRMIAVPGCYPTASLLALKPLQQQGLLDDSQWPVINAVSGVSGAGRKAAANTSFCEVSLTPYGVLGHRHQPEIATQLGAQVIFTPHLGNFKRGILATITVKVAEGVDEAAIGQAYGYYDQHPGVRVMNEGWPKLDQVVGTKYCDLAWKLDADSGHLVIASAIDNLLKGAAYQGLQCINMHFGLEVAHG